MMVKKIITGVVCGMLAAIGLDAKTIESCQPVDELIVGQLNASTSINEIIIGQTEQQVERPISLKFFKQMLDESMQEIVMYLSFSDIKTLLEMARCADTQNKKHMLFARLIFRAVHENYALALEKCVLSQPHPFDDTCWNYLYASGFISHSKHAEVMNRPVRVRLITNQENHDSVSKNHDFVSEERVLSQPHPFDDEDLFCDSEYVSHTKHVDVMKKKLKSPLIMNTELNQEIMIGFLFPEYSREIDIYSSDALLSPDDLESLALRGVRRAQRDVACGLIFGEGGFDINLIKLEEYANAGWRRAQNIIADELAFGSDGFKQDPVKLEEYANAGWNAAQGCVAEGLAVGKYGFTHDPVKLQEYATRGWEDAQWFVAEGLVGGKYGFTHDLVKLEEYANAGWNAAQVYVAEGLSEGTNGFRRNPAKLEEYVNAGWCAAQSEVQYRVIESFIKHLPKFDDLEDLDKVEKLGYQHCKRVQDLITDEFFKLEDRSRCSHPRFVVFSERVQAIKAFIIALRGLPRNSNDRLLYAFHIAVLRLDKKDRQKRKMTNPAPYLQLLQTQKSQGQISATAFAG